MSELVATIAARTITPDDVVCMHIQNRDVLLSTIYSLLWDENNGRMSYGCADRVALVMNSGIEEEYTRGHSTEFPLVIETVVVDEELRVRAREFAALYKQRPLIIDYIPNPLPVSADDLYWKSLAETIDNE